MHSCIHDSNMHVGIEHAFMNKLRARRALTICLSARCSRSAPLHAVLLLPARSIAGIMPGVISRDLRAKVEDLIALAESTGNIYSIVRQILKLLESAGLVYRLRILPRQVLVSRKNRDNYGVGCWDCHDHADVLCDIGWDEEACTPVCAVMSDEDLSFNQVLISEANGMLGSSDLAYLSQAKFVSLSCSHTNFVLRLLLDGVKHDGKQKICKDKHFSMAMAKETQPAMWTTANTGFEWQVVSPEVLDMFPTLSDLIQQQGNTKADRGEHQLQIFRRLHSMIANKTVDGVPPAYADIMDAVLKSKPTCAPALRLS